VFVELDVYVSSVVHLPLPELVSQQLGKRGLSRHPEVLRLLKDTNENSHFTLILVSGVKPECRDYFAQNHDLVAKELVISPASCTVLSHMSFCRLKFTTFVSHIVCFWLLADEEALSLRPDLHGVDVAGTKLAHPIGNLEMNLSINQVHYDLRKTDDFMSEILRRQRARFPFHLRVPIPGLPQPAIVMVYY
jgi:hypothetical protein